MHVGTSGFRVCPTIDGRRDQQHVLSHAQANGADEPMAYLMTNVAEKHEDEGTGPKLAMKFLDQL